MLWSTYDMCDTGFNLKSIICCPVTLQHDHKQMTYNKLIAHAYVGVGCLSPVKVPDRKSCCPYTQG